MGNKAATVEISRFFHCLALHNSVVVDNAYLHCLESSLFLTNVLHNNKHLWFVLLYFTSAFLCEVTAD